jgi:hypothetical protein
VSRGRKAFGPLAASGFALPLFDRLLLGHAACYQTAESEAFLVLLLDAVLQFVVLEQA